MKKKILTGILVLVMIFSTSTVFAVTSTSSKNQTENSVINTATNDSTKSKNTTNSSTKSKNTTNSSSSDNSLSDDEVIPALEEKLKNGENTTNTVSSDDDFDTDSIDEIPDELENAIISSNNNGVNLETVKDQNILSDVYVGSENELLYENVVVDGNVYMISSNKITFKNCKILGNVFTMSSDIEMNNTTVEESAYILANNVNLNGTKIKSVYITAKSINIDKKSEIENDIRAVANTANILGDVGRDSYVQIAEATEIETESTLTAKDVFLNSLAKLAIIVVLAAIILNTSPKFVEVNKKLNFGSFVKAFFTGILEIIIILAIAIGIMFIGYGAEYAFLIIFLILILLGLGKLFFVTSFAVRMVKNSDKNIITKAVLCTIVVGAIVEALGLLSLLGAGGMVATLIINVVLGITGFGTFMRVVLTKVDKFSNNESKIESNDNVAVVTNVPEVKEEPEIKESTELETNKEPENLEETDEIEDSETQEKSPDKSETFEIKGQFVKKDVSKKKKEDKE